MSNPSSGHIQPYRRSKVVKGDDLVKPQRQVGVNRGDDLSRPVDPGFAYKQARAREQGLLDGPRDRRVSVRVEAPLFAAAKAAAGVESDSELVRLALTALAVPDSFGEWLLTQQGRLDKDFDLAD